MTSPTQPLRRSGHEIVDYDSGFDYRAFWGNRDYEQWVEARTLRRLLPRLGRSDWFADFGGGYGRNAAHYLNLAEHTILVDYSVTQLSRAAELLEDQIKTGKLHLMRADLGHLPLIDGAVDTAMVIRVLHHLSDADRCLGEMSRVVGRRWLVDVPIKHHVLARLRSAGRGSSSGVRGPEPIVTGSTEYPFYTFQLAAVRSRLRRAGFRPHSAASVNNFRRWDQHIPPAVVRPLRPVVYPLELALQRIGRGWWGPSQFLFATRVRAQSARLLPADPSTPGNLAGLSRRTRCPECSSQLGWTMAQASCAACGRRYPFREGFWDFSTGAGQPSPEVLGGPDG
ncbi:MAG TPA: class I SAM-dependent methyltransferase [Candidatus Dormibacteraeota bacterium]|nr:class I SAM-dependent methyltransferase [Candidatus Dormibacteraeota bacterium]